MSDNNSYVSVVVTDDNGNVTSVDVALHVILITGVPWIRA